MEVLEDQYILRISSVYESGYYWGLIQAEMLYQHVLVMSWLNDVGGGWYNWDWVGSPG